MRDTMQSLRDRVATLERDNERMFAGFQAAARAEINWYGRKTYDGTSFKFGVFGLTRADGGHIVIQSKVGKDDTPYTVCYLIDDAVRDMRTHVGSEYSIHLGEFYYQAERMRNNAIREQTQSNENVVSM